MFFCSWMHMAMATESRTVTHCGARKATYVRVRHIWPAFNDLIDDNEFRPEASVCSQRRKWHFATSSWYQCAVSRTVFYTENMSSNSWFHEIVYVQDPGWLQYGYQTKFERLESLWESRLYGTCLIRNDPTMFEGAGVWCMLFRLPPCSACIVFSVIN